MEELLSRFMYQTIVVYTLGGQSWMGSVRDVAEGLLLLGTDSGGITLVVTSITAMREVKE